MAFRRGNLLEPVLLEEAGRMLGIPITTPAFMYQNGRFTVSLDGVDNPESPKLIVEAKTTARHRVQSSEDLPREWCWQGWAQQFVTGAEVKFMVLDSDQSLALLDLPINNNAADILSDYAERLGDMIDRNEDPYPEIFEQFTADQVSTLFTPQPTSIEMGDEGEEWLGMYLEAKQSKEESEIMVELAKDALARILKGNEVGLINGVQALTWKEQAGRKSFDSKAFKEDNPTLYENYSKVGTPFRTMRVSKGKQ
jgi:hypothetical protein